MNENNMSAIERVRRARHQERPYSLDLIKLLCEDFLELHGDRRYADDAALVCGTARIGKHEVCVVGHQKGRDLKQRHLRNFGMPKPEGYRKALRVMQLAEKFNRPLITLIDTPGAYPGIDAEERGQAEAIAFNLREMANLRCPVLVLVIGEGGSGGALAIGIGDRILMMENSIYSVITPEGCAAILWKDAAQAPQAAEQLKLTAQNLLAFNLIDRIVPEPAEWTLDSMTAEKNSHRDELKNILIEELDKLIKFPVDELLQLRWQKFRKMGEWRQV